MNISPAYHDRTSFTAFKVPNKEVLNHFADVITKLPPEGRKTFVTEMDKIVKSAKDCPVPIDHVMIGNYEQHYAPVVCGQTIKGKSQYSGVANEILASMRLAAEKAMDRADANSNINKMCNIFGVKNV